jgi:5-methylcytosine-specific restriction endonuclease McrA
MGVPGKATIGRDGYVEYIRSNAWKAVRKRFIASKLPKICQGCGKHWGHGDHLHHRTYKNLGSERLMDLVPLCEPCHKFVHEYANQTGRDLWFATKRACKILRQKRNEAH